MELKGQEEKNKLAFDKKKEEIKIIEENEQRKIKYDNKKMEYEEVKSNFDSKLTQKKLELSKLYKELEIEWKKIENEEKLETVKSNNFRQIELQKIENDKKLFDLKLENYNKIEEFIFKFLNKMVQENKSPEEIIIARNILLHGLNNDEELVNLNEYPVQTPKLNMGAPYPYILIPMPGMQTLMPVMPASYLVMRGPIQGPI